MVNGFDNGGRWGEFNREEASQFPWVELCLDRVVRHSGDASYEILVWDNSWIESQWDALGRVPRVRRFRAATEQKTFGHGRSLDKLLRKVDPATEFVITLDTDAFPIRDGWIENLTGRLDDEVLLAGVWRDELLPVKPPYIHPCCLAARLDTLHRLDTSFRPVPGHDVGHKLTLAAEDAGGRTSQLRRTNVWNAHYLMGAVYGDLVYHQGAGSRNAQFQSDPGGEEVEALRAALRDAAFDDLDRLVGALTGSVPPSEVPEVARLALPTRPTEPD